MIIISEGFEREKRLKRLMETEDWRVQEYAQLLLADRKQMDEEMDSVKPTEFTEGGRYVYTYLVQTLLALCMVVGVVIWWRYPGNAQMMRDALRNLLLMAAGLIPR